MRRVIAIDWDDEYVELVRAALGDASVTVDQIERLSEVREALALGEVWGAWIDADAFTLAPNSPWRRALEGGGLDEIVVLTSGASAPVVAGARVAPRSVGPAQVAAWFEARAQKQGASPRDRRIESAPTMLDRASILSGLGRQLGVELNNFDAVLLSALQECEREALERDPTGGVPEYLVDMRWVMRGLKECAGHLMWLHEPASNAERVLDLGGIVHQTLGALDALGTTKYVGVDAQIATEPVMVTCGQGDLEHMVLSVLTLAAQAASEVTAGERSFAVRLSHDEREQSASLRIELPSLAASSWEAARGAPRAVGEPGWKMAASRAWAERCGASFSIERGEKERAWLTIELDASLGRDRTSGFEAAVVEFAADRTWEQGSMPA